MKYLSSIAYGVFLATIHMTVVLFVVDPLGLNSMAYLFGAIASSAATAHYRREVA
jgi:hypothetical protein